MNERPNTYIYVYTDLESNQRIIVDEENTKIAARMKLYPTSIIVNYEPKDLGPRLLLCADCKTPFISPDGGFTRLRCSSCNAEQEERSRRLAQEYPGTQGDGFFCG